MKVANIIVLFLYKVFFVLASVPLREGDIPEAIPDPPITGISKAERAASSTLRLSITTIRSSIPELQCEFLQLRQAREYTWTNEDLGTAYTKEYDVGEPNRQYDSPKISAQYVLPTMENNTDTINCVSTPFLPNLSFQYSCNKKEVDISAYTGTTCDPDNAIASFFERKFELKKDYCFGATNPFYFAVSSDAFAQTNTDFIRFECASIKFMADRIAKKYTVLDSTVEVNYMDHSIIAGNVTEADAPECDQCTTLLQDLKMKETSFRVLPLGITPAVEEFIEQVQAMNMTMPEFCRPIFFHRKDGDVEERYFKPVCAELRTTSNGVVSTLKSDENVFFSDPACLEEVDVLYCNNKWMESGDCIASDYDVIPNGYPFPRRSNTYGRVDGQCVFPEVKDGNTIKFICNPRNVKGVYSAPTHLNCQTPLSIELPMLFAAVLLFLIFGCFIMLYIYLRTKRAAKRELEERLLEKDESIED